MRTIEVFDPPMCCSTGVCGPKVEPRLADFAADLALLVDRGHHVTRYNLSQEPGIFASNDLVRSLLVAHEDDALPAILVDGDLCLFGRYPSREELLVAVGETDHSTRRASDSGGRTELRIASSSGGCCSVDETVGAGNDATQQRCCD